jgi:hypothetical protein
MDRKFRVVHITELENEIIDSYTLESELFRNSVSSYEIANNCDFIGFTPRTLQGSVQLLFRDKA